ARPPQPLARRAPPDRSAGRRAHTDDRLYRAGRGRAESAAARLRPRALRLEAGPARIRRAQPDLHSSDRGRASVGPGLPANLDRLPGREGLPDRLVELDGDDGVAGRGNWLGHTADCLDEVAAQIHLGRQAARVQHALAVEQVLVHAPGPIGNPALVAVDD